jgi:hypothetical protein
MVGGANGGTIDDGGTLDDHGILYESVREDDHGTLDDHGILNDHGTFKTPDFMEPPNLVDFPKLRQIFLQKQRSHQVNPVKHILSARKLVQMTQPCSSTHGRVNYQTRAARAARAAGIEKSYETPRVRPMRAPVASSVLVK